MGWVASWSRRWLAAVFVLAVFAAGGLVGAFAASRANAGRGVPFLAGAAPSRAGDQVNFLNGFAPVVQQVAGAVVNISSTSVVKAPRGPMEPFLSDPFLRQFFGDDAMPEKRKETALGSGVIVNGNGYILTNNHVVANATEVRVYLSNKREYTAKVAGTDPRTDLAVLKIDAGNLPVMPLGDSSSLQVGDFVLAVGNPFGLGQTVTSGIVSALGRTGLGIEGPGAYEDFIQTDAPINPGNSGGALVDVRGALVGINTAILSGSGGSVGIGFAIPIAMARQVMDQIIQHGKVTRAWMGILPQEVTPAIAQSFGLKQPAGVLVGSVEPNSPAARGSIRQGDILLEMNGKPITDVGEFRIQIGLAKPGTRETFRVWRNNAEQNVTVMLEEMPAQPARGQEPNAPGGAPSGPALEGLSVDNLTPDIARQVGVPAGTKGVVVSEVAPGSEAAEAGLTRGDVIVQVNRKPVTSVDQFDAAVRQAGNGPMLLLVNTRGTEHYVTLEK